MLLSIDIIVRTIQRLQYMMYKFVTIMVQTLLETH